PRSAKFPHSRRIKAAKIRRFGDVSICFQPVLAGLEDFERGKAGSVTPNQVCDPLEQLRAFLYRRPGPTRLRLLCRRQGSVRLGGGGLRGVSDNFTLIGRVAGDEPDLSRNGPVLNDQGVALTERSTGLF